MWHQEIIMVKRYILEFDEIDGAIRVYEGQLLSTKKFKAGINKEFVDYIKSIYLEFLKRTQPRNDDNASLQKTQINRTGI